MAEAGRGERIRTSDTLVPNQVRYQTALRPERIVGFEADTIVGTAELQVEVASKFGNEQLHGSGSVGQLVFRSDAGLGKGLSKFGGVEEGIVSKPSCALTLSQNRAFAGPTCDNAFAPKGSSDIRQGEG